MPLNRFAGGAGQGDVSEIDQEMAKRVVETLEPVVGAEACGPACMWSTTSARARRRRRPTIPASAVALSMTRSEETSGQRLDGRRSRAPAAILPNAKVSPSGKSDEPTQSSKSESGTYGVNKLVRHTIQPAGRIKRIAAALLVDDAVQVEQQNNKRVATRRKRTAEEMKQIEELAAAALGIDAKRGDLLAVENLSFQNLQQDAPLPPTMLEKLQRNLQQLDLAASLSGAGLPVRQRLPAAVASGEETDADRLKELPLRAAASRPIAGEAKSGEVLPGR